MNTQIAVDLEHLAQVVSRLDGLEEFVSGQLTELDRRVAKLHNSWTGAAADAYHRSHREWSTNAGELAGAIGTMRQVAEHARNQYAQALETNRRMLRGE